jgi:hypothetical protein
VRSQFWELGGDNLRSRLQTNDVPVHGTHSAQVRNRQKSGKTSNDAIADPNSLGFGVWGLGFGVWGLGFGVWGLGFGVWGLGFGVWGLGFGVWGLGFGVWGLGFGVWGLGFGFMVLSCCLSEGIKVYDEKPYTLYNPPPYALYPYTLNINSLPPYLPIKNNSKEAEYSAVAIEF